MSAAGSPGGAPIGVAVVGCGTVSEEYLPNLTSFPDLNVLFCADLDLARAKDQAAKYGIGACGSLAQALEHPGVELVVNLTLPVRARRGGLGRDRGRQARVEREAAHHRSGHRPGPAGPGHPGRGPPGLRPGHRAGRGPADRAAAHRRRRDRRPADGADPDAEPRPGELAPKPGVLVPIGSGPAVRPRPVLFLGPGHDLRPGGQGGGDRPPGGRHPGHRLRAQGRPPVPGRRAHPRRRAGRVRRRWRRFAAVQLRLTAAAARARGDHRDRGHDGAAGPEPVRR